jgi:hypothetical protein
MNEPVPDNSLIHNYGNIYMILIYCILPKIRTQSRITLFKCENTMDMYMILTPPCRPRHPRLADRLKVFSLLTLFIYFARTLLNCNQCCIADFLELYKSLWAYWHGYLPVMLLGIDTCVKQFRKHHWSSLEKITVGLRFFVGSPVASFF